MIILGLIIVLIALALGAALLMGTSATEVSSQDVDISLLDSVTINLNPLTLVVAGMATMLLLWLGLVLIKAALTRKAKQRRLRKEQAIEARERQAQQEAAHRDEVTERHDPALEQPTQRIDTGIDTPGTDALRGDATRPIRRDPRA